MTRRSRQGSLCLLPLPAGPRRAHPCGRATSTLLKILKRHELKKVIGLDNLENSRGPLRELFEEEEYRDELQEVGRKELCSLDRHGTEEGKDSVSRWLNGGFYAAFSQLQVACERPPGWMVCILFWPCTPQEGPHLQQE